MDIFKSQSSRIILTLGLLAGAFLLFTGAVGMIAAFHEREVINDFITLGQLLLLRAPLAASIPASPISKAPEPMPRASRPGSRP